MVIIREPAVTPTQFVQGAAPDAPETPTPQPTATPTPQPTATPTPMATPTATPTPTPSPTATPELGETISIDLNQGWNIISFQALPTDTSLTNVLASIDGLYSEVNTIVDGQVLVYTPESAADGSATLTNIDGTHGYWIKMRSTATLTVTGQPVDLNASIELQPGWNLIPYLSEDARMPRQALTSIAGKFDEVRGFDGEAMSFFPALPVEFNTLDSMEPGQGYLIHVTEQATLIYP